MLALGILGILSIFAVTAIISQRRLNRRRNLDIVDPSFARLRDRHRP